MWELLTCEVPFEGLNQSQVQGMLEQGRRPELPSPLPSGFERGKPFCGYIILMKLCWHQVIAMAIQPKDVKCGL